MYIARHNESIGAEQNDYLVIAHRDMNKLDCNCDDDYIAKDSMDLLGLTLDDAS